MFVSSTVEQATRSLLRQQSHRGFIPPVSENIILDNGVLEGAGTYQGGGQKTNPRNLNKLDIVIALYGHLSQG